MPLPAIASASMQAIGSFAGAYAQERANKRNMDFQWKMWNANNEYNTPLNQRLRMEAAGFNPALMYGNGSVDNTSRPMGGVDIKPVNPVAGLADSISTYYQMQIAELQAQNLKKDLQVKDTNILANTSNALNKDSQTATNKFRLDQLDRNKDTVNQQMLENLTFSQMRNLNLFNENSLFPLKKESLDLSNTKTLNEINQIKASTKAIDLDNVAREINNTALPARVKIETLTLMRNYKNAILDSNLKKADIMLKAYEMRLNKFNLTKSDNAILKDLIQSLKTNSNSIKANYEK